MQRLMQQRWIKAIARTTLISLFTQLMLTGLAQAADNVVYFHNDALGSPVAATDQSGRVLWREEYKPYGKRLLNQNESADNKLWFTGKYEEAELGGLQYFGARWYHPDAGRFMSMDPVGVKESVAGNPMMFNRYAYANNNPYKYVDPDGREVKVNWHGVAFGKNHSLITITPDNPSHFNNAKRISSIGQLTNSEGKRYGTMGAGPNGAWNLESNYNRESDAAEHAGGIIITPPNGMSEEKFVDNLIQLDSNYQDNKEYSFNPDGKKSFNSNSYVSGILRAAGVDVSIVSVPSAPGFDKPLPQEAFEKKGK